MSSLPQLKLVHKMILLLVIPAAIQAVLVCLLISLDDRAARASQLAQQQSRAIKIIDDLIFDFGLTFGSLVSNVIGPGKYPDGSVVPPAYMRQNFLLDKTKAGTEIINYRDYRGKMRSNLASLRETCTNDEERAVVDRASTMVEQQATALEQLESQPVWQDENGAHPVAVLNEIRVLRRSIRSTTRFFHDFRQLLASNYNRQQKYLEEEANERLAIRNYIVIVLGAQAILSLCLVIWFSRDVANRLKLLVDNADSMPLLKDLPNQVRGADELAHLDQTLHKAVADLKNSDSLKNNLLNMVAHDVRSPLASASLMLNSLTPGAGDDSAEKRAATVATLGRMFKAINSLVDDLLSFQRADSGKMELSYSSFSLNACIQEVITEVSRTAAEKEISISLKTHDDVEIIADQTKIGQVLRNYLTNAVKFSPKGSTVEVLWKRVDKGLRVSVFDNGKGLAAKDAANVFEQFIQVPGTSSELGFGLGLHICKTIVQLHGGEVGVNSKPGQGSEFWFVLPLDEAPDEGPR